MPTSSHTGAASLAAVEAGGVRPPFDVFDDVVRLRDSHGVLAVRLANHDHVAAIAAHIERRARATGRETVRASDGSVESGWRDALTRLGITRASHDPVDAARSILRRAAQRRALLIVPLLAPSAWDEAVCDAICELATDTLIVLLTTREVRLEVPRAAWFEIEERLDEAALGRWWDAVASDQRTEQDSNLVGLQRWLDAALVARPREATPAVPEAHRRLLERLALAQRAWPLSALSSLGDEIALASLRAAGLAEVRDGFAVARPGTRARAPLAGETLVVARALAETFPEDAWALVRAAELFAQSARSVESETCVRRALELGLDAESRAELWRRWRRVVESGPDDERGRALIRSAEFALELGDVDIALEWAESAAAADGGARAAYVLGRASLARGDLVTADAALSRARDLSTDKTQRQQAEIELAEVRYASGDLDAAERLVGAVVDATDEMRVRLGARNLLGKLMLARSEWDRADAHFAGDACEAAFAGEFVAELRARVNRAIALLSRGSPDEARPMLLDVLTHAEQRGEARAVGFAISNLAVLAIERHDYGQALELSERAIVVRRRLGDRLGFARDVTNLVELRLRLGLVDQAEEALRFGRQALGPGAPASRLAELALAAARVHLAKGRTLEADREVRTALRTAAHASDGDKLGECHRLAARIALEDGIVTRAEAEVARARELVASPFAEAEVALLDALVNRAAGRLVSDRLSATISAARESGDEELAREAHVLAAEVALGEGDLPAAAEHVGAAIALREEVARAIRRETRDAYLARRDLLRLARLERLLEEPAEEEEPASVRSSVRPKPTDHPASFVGRHPSVRALIDSVKRVGRTGATVLIHGESGTGKELVAEAIHAASDRASGPLVKVNCAALVESLLLSELFGHEKGAFTGAATRRRGRFERASGGTLFLDEIGDISPRTQVALLRVLEERSIERVGGSAAIPVDVRIVCATNRDLHALVERGEFREDLYYRLSGIALEVPPLRDRPADLPLLCDSLLARIGRERGEDEKKVTPDALELLARHRWPGNVRELENALRAASLFAEGSSVELADLVDHVEVLRKLSTDPAPLSTSALARLEMPRSVSSLPAAPLPRVSVESLSPVPDMPVTGAAYREIRDAGVSLSDLKRRIERECIARALAETDGNITRAAAVLGMKRPRLSQLVKQYGLLANAEEGEL